MSEKDVIIARLKELTDDISQINGEMDRLLYDVAPLVAKFEKGQIVQSDGHRQRKTYRKIIDVRAEWSQSFKAITIVYSTRKVRINGELHSMINKTKDFLAKGWVPYGKPGEFGDTGIIIEGFTRPE